MTGVEPHAVACVSAARRESGGVSTRSGGVVIDCAPKGDARNDADGESLGDGAGESHSAAGGAGHTQRRCRSRCPR